MKSIDFKSLLIGILGTALAMVLLGVTHKNNKYQISDSVILNTTTGVAKMTCYQNYCSPHYEGNEDKGLERFYHPLGKPADF